MGKHTWARLQGCVRRILRLLWASLETGSAHHLHLRLLVSLCSDGHDDDDDDDAGSLDILMEAPEGFRNSDEECFSESQVNVIMGFVHQACEGTFF